MSGAIVTNTFRQSNADNFKNSIEETVDNEYVNKYYLVIGRPEPWDDDKNPPNPTDSPVSESKISRDLIAGKQILSTNVKHVVPRVNWAPNTKYEPYDHDKLNSEIIDLSPNPFYVLTSTNDVWVCISNNKNGNTGAEYTDEPALSTGTYVASPGDGYVWQHLYHLSTDDIQDFLSLDFMPVNVKDTGNTSLVLGGVETIEITDNNGGSGYTNTTGTLCDIIGDGEGAKASIIVESNTITSATVTFTGTSGKPYTFASVDLSSLTHNGTGSVADLKPIISPIFGHGGNNPKELGAVFIMIQMNLEGDELASGGKFIVNQDFRQLGILKNPTTSLPTLPTTISCLKSMTFTSSSDLPFDEDEVIYQTQPNGIPDARGIVVDDEVISSEGVNTHTLRYIQQNEAGLGLTNHIITPFDAAGAVVSTERDSTTSTDVVGAITAIYPPDIDENSGDIIYVENRRPISRSTDQTENIKLIVEF